MTARPWTLEHARALAELLAAPLAESLEAMVVKLLPTLGNFAQPRSHGSGDPDGYAGLGGSANYERLLLSEWLLADEAPDEFLRRAVQGEHSFLALARHQSHQSRRCVVKLDMGPFMLGLPRIASLAALLALERRALAANAEFVWSVLGSEMPARKGISDAADVRAWLEARSARAPQLSDLSVDDRLEGDELWLIASPYLPTGNRFSNIHRLTMDEQAETRAVQVNVALPARAPRAVVLPMPEPQRCVQLLRDPLQLRVAPTASTSVGPLIRLSANGTRLLTLDGKTLRALCVPNHPGGAAGKARQFVVPDDEQLLACTYTDRLTVVTLRGNEVHLYGLNNRQAPITRRGRCALSVQLDQPLPFQPSGALNECLFLASQAQFAALLPVAPDTTLRVNGPDAASAGLLKERLVACAQAPRSNTVYAIIGENQKLSLREQLELTAESSTVLTFDEPHPEQVRFLLRQRTAGGSCMAVRHGQRVVLYIRHAMEDWRKKHELFIPEGAQWVGLSSPYRRWGVQLVALDHTSKQFLRIDADATTVLHQLESTVVDAQICPASSRLVYSTKDELVVYDVLREGVLCRYPRQWSDS